MNDIVTNDGIFSAVALKALKNVRDPEIGLNIVDLGLIYQLDCDETGKKIYCSMTLTTQFCPMGESITDTAEEVLKESFPDYEIVLKLTFNPTWTQGRISAEGRQFLNN